MLSASLKLEATTAYITEFIAFATMTRLAPWFYLKLKLKLIIYETLGLHLVHCDKVHENRQ